MTDRHSSLSLLNSKGQPTNPKPTSDTPILPSPYFRREAIEIKQKVRILLNGESTQRE